MTRLTDVTNEGVQTLIGPDMHPVTFSCSRRNPNTPTCDSWARNTLRQLSLVEGTSPAWRVEDNQGMKWDFDAQGRLEAVEDRNENRLVLDYEGTPEQPESITVTDDLGRQMAITYDSNYRIETVTADDRTVTFTYDGGELALVEYSDGNSLSYEYVDPQPQQGVEHRLEGVRDAHQNLVEFYEYSADGHVLHAITAEGDWEFLYGDASSTTRTVTDFRGEDTIYSIDAFKGVATGVEGPGCSSCGNGPTITRTFDGRLNATSIVDALGVETRRTYYREQFIGDSLRRRSGHAIRGSSS